MTTQPLSLHPTIRNLTAADCGPISDAFTRQGWHKPVEQYQKYYQESLEGKRVVVVDDSIVRGTTSRKIVTMIRSAGAREVHMRISSPPTISPCFYGIDTPTRRELIASTHSVEEIRKYLRADSLGYLSLEGLQASAGKQGSFCHACFSLEYPIHFPDEEQDQLRLFESDR